MVGTRHPLRPDSGRFFGLSARSSAAEVRGWDRGAEGLPLLREVREVFLVAADLVLELATVRGCETAFLGSGELGHVNSRPHPLSIYEETFIRPAQKDVPGNFIPLLIKFFFF